MKALSEWRQAPGSLESHPDQLDEHFVPLFVAAGAAQGNPARLTGGIFNNLPLTCFAFES